MQADYVLNHNMLAVGRAYRLYLMARLKAKPAPDDITRPPLNLSVVLDRSGSMSGDKLDYAKKALEFLIRHLSPRDRFSLVTYDERAKVAFEPAPVTNKDQIIQAIRQIEPGSTTNLSGGWLRGCQLVTEGGLDPAQVNRVLLLSDGVANVGVRDIAQLASWARQKRGEGIITSTMGLGLDFQEDLMTAMAAEGGGSFYFIDDPDQAPSFFAEELRGLLSVIAQNLTVTLQPSQTIRTVRQLNMYPVVERGSDKVYMLGDLFGDDIKTLVLELHIPAPAQPGEIQLATLQFDYDEITGPAVAHQTQRVPVTAECVSAEAHQSTDPHPDVAKQVLLLSAAQARSEAIRLADDGDYATASDFLNKAADKILSAPLDDDDLRTEHDLLREEAVSMHFGADVYDKRLRKTLTSTVFYSTRHMGAVIDKATRSRNHLRQTIQARERQAAPPSMLVWGQEVYDLLYDRMTIGRHIGNDIVVADPGVSETHCQIVREGETLYLEDLDSTNGTFANGGKINGRFRLSVGDVIAVGPRVFRAQ